MAFPFFVGGWTAIKRVSKITLLWGSGIAQIMNLKVNIIGDISSFKGGLIVSNHMGYIDIIAHASSFPIRFTPKAEISRWPILGFFLGLNRPIWIDRRSKQKSRETMNQFRMTMKNGIPLIVYPEGTSTSGLDGILPFKSTPFEAAVSENCPILPIVTIYKDKTVCWWGDMTLLPHIWQISGYKGIEVDLHVLPAVYPEGRSRKEMAKYVHDLMEEEYEKIMGKSVENKSKADTDEE
jgi:1-acyl-sn-glycerol-3-phosphate acyltransferase